MALLGRHTARIVLASRWFGETFSVLQQVTGTRNEHGEWIPGANVTTSVTGSAAPIQSKERQNLPEAERVKDVWIFQIPQSDFEKLQPLRVGVSAQTEGDIILFKGLQYRIFRRNDYSSHGHISVYASRREGQDD